MNNKLNERISVNCISNDIKEALGSKYIGKPNRKKFYNAICNVLRKYHHRNIIGGGYRIDGASSLWERMTLSDKFKWYLCNKIFPSIGLEIRRLKREYDNILIQYDSNGEDMGSGVDLSDYSIDLPSWAEKDPKSMIDADITIKLNEPLEYINMKFEISDDFNEES